MPGVVIIDEIFHGLASKNPDIKVEEISTIKFLKPLIPDTPVTAKASQIKPGLLEITLHQNELLIVSGQLRIAADQSS